MWKAERNLTVTVLNLEMTVLVLIATSILLASAALSGGTNRSPVQETNRVQDDGGLMAFNVHVSHLYQIPDKVYAGVGAL